MESYDFDALAGGLVGERLTGVRYYDTPCFGERSDEWDEGGVHVLGHGVDLILGDRSVGITWGNELLSYHLAAYPFPLVEFLLAGRFELVPERAPWPALVQRLISSAVVHRVQRDEGDGPVEYPLALEVTVEGGERALLAAANWSGAGTPAFSGGDDLLVLWQPDSLRAVLPELAAVAAEWGSSS